VKEPDLAFVPIGPNGLHRDFPSVILESGWASTGPKLVDDHFLWHEGSGWCVNVVILLKFRKVNLQNQVAVTLEISRTTPFGIGTAGINWVSFVLPASGLLICHLLM